MKFVRAFTILSLSAVSVNALAQVYRCTTPTGGTEFSQIPCGKDSKLTQDRARSIDTGPPTDPFGVQRERGRLQLEADYNRKKSSGDTPTNERALRTHRERLARLTLSPVSAQTVMLTSNPATLGKTKCSSSGSKT